MPIYDITDHALLSDDVEALSPEAIVAHNIIAERVLGLIGMDVSDADDIAALTAAVALQVNYQVSLDPAVWAVKEEQIGPLKTVYRDNLPPVNGLAMSMVVAVLPELSLVAASAWNTAGPVR